MHAAGDTSQTCVRQKDCKKAWAALRHTEIKTKYIKMKRCHGLKCEPVCRVNRISVGSTQNQTIFDEIIGSVWFTVIGKALEQIESFLLL